MPTGKPELLTGTLEMLVLKTLSLGDLHGYGIAQHIQRLSNEALHVEEGSLYPALQRMQAKGWVKSEWKTSPTGRRARYYTLTTPGRKQLAAESETFDRNVAAILSVMRTADA
jgi:PadR family transcriptional regulator, regulatory protein PadR